ncbi:MAG: hypothetical protein ACM3OC_07065 [Deltaproteobacteria bacterium]
MRRKRRGKARYIELLVTKEGEVAIANAGSKDMALVRALAAKKPSAAQFLCG